MSAPIALAVLRGRIEEKRAQLHAMQPLRDDAARNLRHYYDIELTYTSNAIEGNTLSAAETELVIDKRIAIAGKPLRDHMEAIDHHAALGYVRKLAADARPLTEMDVRQLQELIVLRSNPAIAGRYADTQRFARTEEGRHAFPSPAKVPPLMTDFGIWLQTLRHDPAEAFEAHHRLVTIHPFNDGNGRAARLLMNLILIRGGYPPIAIRPEDRPVYMRSLADAQAGRGTDAYDQLMHDRLDATLSEYLRAFEDTRRE